MTDTPSRLIIALLGGAGKEGSGLALRWANAGHTVVIGSRDPARAAEAAANINARLGREAATGTDNLSAARAGELVVLAVPYSAQIATVEAVRDALAGKILIDVTVPLVPPKVARVQLPASDSAVVAVQTLLGVDVRVVSAFQNISAHHLVHLDAEIDCDVLVCADDKAAGETVVALAREIGLGAFYAGVLANSVVAEALTSVLIALNQRYKVPGAGIRLTGIPRD
ncbi:NADPH-dependent F420 reductase [Novosphingobium sp.]|uniref:NADPH-dependent F420 reductase n=1 Tax=Novosphingobium sp. TaxID=1874826 RepID=UPI0025D8736C|nr:NADPH-dependent F420 reductase [Novosphingobium sp.]